MKEKVLCGGDVIGVDYLKSLQIRGNLTRDFGGPMLSFEKFVFSPDDDGTTITYTLDAIGNAQESTLQSIKEGWEEILKMHFKNYCINKE